MGIASVTDRFLETSYRLTKALAQLWKFLGPKDKKRNRQNDEQMHGLKNSLEHKPPLSTVDVMLSEMLFWQALLPFLSRKPISFYRPRFSQDRF
jgi:hypothetical protein